MPTDCFFVADHFNVKINYLANYINMKLHFIRVPHVLIVLHAFSWVSVESTDRSLLSGRQI